MTSQADRHREHDLVPRLGHSTVWNHKFPAMLRTSLVCCALGLTACGFPRPPDVAQCSTSSDCTSTNAPFCVHGTCVASCGINDDCQANLTKPFCEMTTGQCVGCLDGTNCPAD